MTPLTLEPFDRRYLKLSGVWLNDPETKRLMMAPDFTADDQERFFRSFPRPDYVIWGIAYEGRPVGVASLKGIAGEQATFAGYLGDASVRGKGLGRAMLTAVLHEARVMKLSEVRLEVLCDNVPALALYRSTGFEVEKRHEDKMCMRLVL